MSFLWHVFLVFFLKRKPHRQLHPPIVGRASKPARSSESAAEAGIDARRLPELIGRQHALVSAGIGVVQNVGEVRRQRQAVAVIARAAAVAPEAAVGSAHSTHAHTAATTAAVRTPA